MTTKDDVLQAVENNHRRVGHRILEKTMKCHYCGKTNDLRPYGPKGAMVCFSCAMSTPERKAETEHNFAVQLDAAGPVAMIDGTEVGPYPAKHAKVHNDGGNARHD